MALRRVDGVGPVPLPRPECTVRPPAHRHGEVPRRRRPERRHRGAQRPLPARRHARRAALRRGRVPRRSAARATTPAGASPRTRSATSPSTRCSTSTRRSGRGRRLRPSHRALRPAHRGSAGPRGAASASSPCRSRSSSTRWAATSATTCRTRCCRGPIPFARCSTPASPWRCRRTRRWSRTTRRWPACRPPSRRRDADGQAVAPDQAITLDEALDAYTRGGAIASGDEADRGCLRAGMRADLTVLSGNLDSARRPTHSRRSA